MRHPKPADESYLRAKQVAGVWREGRQSPTEQRHPRSMNLDKLPLREAVTRMLNEEAGVPGKLLAERRRIEQVIRAKEEVVQSSLTILARRSTPCSGSASCSRPVSRAS